MRAGARIPLAMLLIAAAAPAARLVAQQTGSAAARTRASDASEGHGSVRGLITDAGGGGAIAGAEVLLTPGGRSAATDSTGHFAILDIPSGHYILQIRHLGYGTRRDTVKVRPGDAIEVRAELSDEAVALPPMNVVAHPSALAAAGFYARRSRGIGSFFTRADIERRHVRRLSDLLAGVAGLRRTIRQDGTSRIEVRGPKTLYSRCETQYFLDGVQADIAQLDVDVIPIRDILGIEIYRGASELPGRFDVGSAMCGAVLIWTRDGSDTP